MRPSKHEAFQARMSCPLPRPRVRMGAAGRVRAKKKRRRVLAHVELTRRFATYAPRIERGPPACARGRVVGFDAA